TGHSPARHQIHGHFATHEQNAARSMPDWLDPKVPTLASTLKEAGYATAHFGKWHLGNGNGAPPPIDYGFDVAKTVNSNGDQLGDEGKDPYFRAKSTSLIVDETIKFIKAHKDKPFYANVWTLLPHAPLKPTPEQLKEYESLAPSANDPGFGPWMQKYLADAKDLKSQMQVFCASLTDLDTQLGRLFTALDELKLAEDTIIFYSSDNGAEDYRIGNAANGGVGNTGPLRARKRSMYEGGIRTFGLLRWPGHVTAGKRDETSVVGGVDFLPTICKLTGVKVPAGVQPDGEDVSDIWLGKPRARTKPLYWEWLFNVAGGKEGGYMPPMLTVRDGDWKLFVSHDGTHGELFNIPRDISEEHNVATANPDIVKSLTAKALAWTKTLPSSPARDKVLTTGLPQDRGPAPKSANKKAPTITPAQRAVSFKKWDTDKDGILTLEEYKTGLKGQENLEARFKNFDKNGDGKMTLEEFGGPADK
ncbi:MAG TPA: sulfatase-like hydrolase/transferase, partial [Roseimicrobium sp.]|nr:sulfatase-like hydrolase/transferase [Roseimicrobium sp.]